MKGANIYLVEDDKFLVEALTAQMEDLGGKVTSFADATSLISKGGRAPEILICDLHIPPGASVRGRKTANNTAQGLEVLRHARKKWPKTKIALITGMPSMDARQWCADNDAAYLLKPIAREALERLMGLRKLRAFVVHGRDIRNREKAVSALRKARIEPVVLMQQPNLGRTIIEKFEAVADSCDTAVVVWSPDDFGGLNSTGSKSVKQSRARQNVVFELGYFYGALRRRSGCVVVLEFGDTELPSDINGVLRIDGTVPISGIVDILKQEFRHLLD